MNILTEVVPVATEQATNLYSLLSLIVTAVAVPILGLIIKIFSEKPKKADPELKKAIDGNTKKIEDLTGKVDGIGARLSVVEKSELQATAYRLNQTIDKIVDKVNKGIDIAEDLVVFVNTRKSFKVQGGNGDFDDKHENMIMLIKEKDERNYRLYIKLIEGAV